MIEIVNLRKKFKHFDALKAINLHVSKGEIYGFIGKNGAGKSTTMNIMAGLSKPNSGSCRVNGYDITTIKHPHDLSIGYLPESPSFYGWMTARESLEYLKSGCRHLQPAKSGPDPEDMLAWVGLLKSADRRIGGFSRGMKQRLGLCQVLMHEPELLILDEPSSALDPEGRSDILRLIRELNQMGKTIIFSTHILSDVERICHTVGMISDGRMIMEKPLSDMMKQDVTTVYVVELITPLEPAAINSFKSSSSRISAIWQESNRLSITVTDEESGSQAIINWLSAQAIPIRSLSLRQQSLEELFIQEVNGK